MHGIVHANIAGLTIRLCGFHITQQVWSDWDEFVVEEETKTPDLSISFKQKESFTSNSASPFTIGPLTFRIDNKQTIFGYSNMNNSTKVNVVVSTNWDDAAIELNEAVMHALHFQFFTDIVFRTRLSYLSGFTAHASVIAYNGAAVMFAAKSGVGKSTHSELWKEHLSAEIINGDHAIVRIIDGCPVVFGSPWSGTSPYKKRTSAPLRAIVLLEQSDKNTISRLDLLSASRGFLPHCYISYWNEISATCSLRHIDTVLHTIPVYHLMCLPNKEAVELVRDTVYH